MLKITIPDNNPMNIVITENGKKLNDVVAINIDITTSSLEATITRRVTDIVVETNRLAVCKPKGPPCRTFNVLGAETKESKLEAAEYVGYLKAYRELIG